MNKEKTLTEIPKTLQGILWSASISNLDLIRDKNYIIHQILVYGSLEQIRWLFEVYGREEIKKTFVKNPNRIYYPATFNFVKNIVLGLEDVSLNKERYVQNIS